MTDNLTATTIGLDGFRFGWVAVVIAPHGRSIHFPNRIDWLAQQTFSRAFIDIPIGMTEDGVRACEAAARKLLRPHASRVFSGARRWLWEEFSDPDDANAEAARRGQTRISRQLWHIGPKIMEVDSFVRAHASLDVRETHPELVFRRLNGGEPVPTKHSEEGIAVRCALLRAAGFDEIGDWLANKRMRTGAKADDVLDACAAALAARDCLHALPERDAPVDSKGLPMQIWY